MNQPFKAYGRNMRWFEATETAGLRLVGLAHEVSPAGYAYSRNAVEHTGWYLSDDNWTGKTVAGVVYQLPGKNGRARYLAGYADPWNDGAACLSIEVIEGDARDSSWDSDDGLRDAAREADSIAERMAEKERDYQRAWRAGRDCEDKRDEVIHIRRELLAALAERDKTLETKTPNLCAMLRRIVESRLDQIRELREEIERLKDEFGRDEGFAD